MKIKLETFGGLAGGLGRRPSEIDSAELPESDRDTLRRLVSAAVSAEPPRIGRSAVPDAQTYEITIEDGGRTEVLQAGDGNLPAAYAELRNWLRAH